MAARSRVDTMLCCMQRLEDGTTLAGAAGLMLADGVTYLDPETAVFEAMLAAGTGSSVVRAVKPQVISNRIGLVRRLACVSNHYP